MTRHLTAMQAPARVHVAKPRGLGVPRRIHMGPHGRNSLFALYLIVLIDKNSKKIHINSGKIPKNSYKL